MVAQVSMSFMYYNVPSPPIRITSLAVLNCQSKFKSVTDVIALTKRIELFRFKQSPKPSISLNSTLLYGGMPCKYTAEA
jgi:hypothetical protein